MRNRIWNGSVVTAAVVTCLLLPTPAWAHVSIWPRESAPGATEKYVLRVPAEGTAVSTSVELEVPEGVTVETVAVPAGWKYTLKKDKDRIVGIMWVMDIKPGEFAEFSFVARNPRDKPQLVWTINQKFADGTTSNWTTSANGATRPTAVTKLVAPKVQ